LRDLARTQAAAELTAQHRRLQLRLSAATARDFLVLWPIWAGDPASYARLVAAAVPLVESRHRTSSGLASGYYRAFRFAEGAEGDATPRLAQFQSDRVVASLYVTGQTQTAASLRAGMTLDEARRAALVRTMGAVTRHTLAGGRDTIDGSVRADAQAVGWQRVTGGKPCHFCVMLSSRGPVYKQQTVGFRAHDHCSCTNEPVYSGGEWSAQNRAHRDLWAEHAQGSDDPLNALRQALSAA
jgi:hypothetical protein